MTTQPDCETHNILREATSGHDTQLFLKYSVSDASKLNGGFCYCCSLICRAFQGLNVIEKVDSKAVS